MARGDYRGCDVCDGKAFYDANLNYSDGPSQMAPRPPFRVAGKEQYESNPSLRNAFGARLDYVGDWAVLCNDCAKTHKTVIVPIGGQERGEGEGNG